MKIPADRRQGGVSFTSTLGFLLLLCCCVVPALTIALTSVTNPSADNTLGLILVGIFMTGAFVLLPLGIITLLVTVFKSKTMRDAQPFFLLACLFFAIIGTVAGFSIGTS